MKRFVLLLLSVSLAVGLFFCENKEKKEEKAEMKFLDEFKDVQRKTIEPFYYVALGHVGPYSDHQQVIEKFISLAEDQDLVLTGPLMGFYFNNPQEVPPDQLEWAIGFRIEDSTDVEDPLYVEEWNFPDVISASYVGSPENATPVYNLLDNYMREYHLAMSGPAVEIFKNPHGSPGMAGDSLQVEVWFPYDKVPEDSTGM